MASEQKDNPDVISSIPGSSGPQEVPDSGYVYVRQDLDHRYIWLKKGEEEYQFLFVGKGAYKQIFANKVLGLVFNMPIDSHDDLCDPLRLAHKFHDLAGGNKALYDLLYRGVVKDSSSAVKGYICDYIPDIKHKQADDLQIFEASLKLYIETGRYVPDAIGFENVVNLDGFGSVFRDGDFALRLQDSELNGRPRAGSTYEHYKKPIDVYHNFHAYWQDEAFGKYPFFLALIKFIALFESAFGAQKTREIVSSLCGDGVIEHMSAAAASELSRRISSLLSKFKDFNKTCFCGDGKLIVNPVFKSWSDFEVMIDDEERAKYFLLQALEKAGEATGSKKKQKCFKRLSRILKTQLDKPGVNNKYLVHKIYAYTLRIASHHRKSLYFRNINDLTKHKTASYQAASGLLENARIAINFNEKFDDDILYDGPNGLFNNAENPLLRWKVVKEDVSLLDDSFCHQ